MRWSNQKEKLHQRSQSTTSLQEKINYYYLNSDKDTKDLESLRETMGMKSHLFEELIELVERV